MIVDGELKARAAETCCYSSNSNESVTCGRSDGSAGTCASFSTTQECRAYSPVDCRSLNTNFTDVFTEDLCYRKWQTNAGIATKVLSTCDGIARSTAVIGNGFCGVAADVKRRDVMTSRSPGEADS